MKTSKEIKEIRTTYATEQSDRDAAEADAWIEANSPQIERDMIEFGAFRCFIKQSASHPTNPRAMRSKVINKIVATLEANGFKASCKEYTAGIWDLWIYLTP